MDQTFYRVFVGGDSVPGCEETVKKYAEKGVSFPSHEIGFKTHPLSFRSGRSHVQLLSRSPLRSLEARFGNRSELDARDLQRRCRSR